MSEPTSSPTSMGDVERHLHGDHAMLTERIDQLEHQMNERMMSMQEWFIAEVRDLRSFIIKALVWLSGPLALSITSLFVWEWQQASDQYSSRTEQAQMVAKVVQQQADMVDRLTDLRTFNETMVRNSEEKNRAFIDALNQIVHQHLNGPDHRE